MKKIIILFFILTFVSLLGAGAVLAGDESSPEPVKKDTAVIDAPTFYNFVIRSIEELELYRELWKEANRRSDLTKENEYNAIVDEIVRKDLENTRLVLSWCARMVVMDNAARKAELPAWSELYDYEKLFKDVNIVLRSKEVLAKGIHRSDMFSIKYRLLGDYIQLQRRELDMPALKLASHEQDF